MEARIRKIEKGFFVIEYKDELNPFGLWKEVGKAFKTRPKAEEYIRKHGLNKKRRLWR